MDPHQKKIIEAAGRLGIQVELLENEWALDAIRLDFQGQSEIVSLGRVFSHLKALADQIAANKVAAKALMKNLGIPVPESLKLKPEQLNIQEIDDFLIQYKTLVAKPLFGTDGEGIAMHLQTANEIVNHIQNNAQIEGDWLLEEQVSGEDLRLQYLNGKLIAACIRKPCYLTGNGNSSIQSQIGTRNELIQQQNADNFIHIDHQVKRRLSKAGLQLDSILAEGREFQLKDVSNMAQGGHAIDVTGRVHPTYQVYLDRLAKALDIRLFSLDVMAASPEADPKDHAHVLEFNAQPAWLHHTFSEGRQHNIPELILKDLFQIT